MKSRIRLIAGIKGYALRSMVAIGTLNLEVEGSIPSGRIGYSIGDRDGIPGVTGNVQSANPAEFQLSRIFLGFHWA